MPTKIQKALMDCVERSIANGGKSYYTRSVAGFIDYKVYKTLLTMKKPAPIKTVRNLGDYIENQVSKFLKDTAAANKVGEPAIGFLIVLSPEDKQGKLEFNGRLVYFANRFSVKIGDRVQYRFNGKTYTLIQTEEGYIPRPKGMPGGDWNLLVRHGGSVFLNEFSKDLGTGVAAIEASDSQITMTDMHVWHEPVDGEKFSYFVGKVYKETANPAGAEETDISIDLTSTGYMLDAASLTSVTYSGRTFTRSRGKTKVMKIIPFRNYRLILLMTSYTWAGSFQYLDEYYQQLYTSSHAFYNDLYDLVILNVDDGSSVKYGPNHSEWTVIPCQQGFAAGYLDVKVDASDPTLLLVLKSNLSPASASMNVNYYRAASVPSDPVTFLHTAQANVLQMAYSLDRYSVDSVTGGLVLDSAVYSDSGVVSTYSGPDYPDTAITGGVINMGFTQQPQSGYIYLYRSIAGYKQDSTVQGSPVFNWRECHMLTSIGWVEILDTSNNILYKRLSRATAALATVIPYSEANTHLLDVAWTSSCYVIGRYIPKFFAVFRPTENNLRKGTNGENGGAEKFVNQYYTTGRPVNSTSFSMFNSGTQTVSLSYPTDAASHLHKDRFVAITDHTNYVTKFLWFIVEVIVVASYRLTTDEPPVERVDWGNGESQGYFFFKVDTDQGPMDVLHSYWASNQQTTALVSSRAYGGFVKLSDDTRLEFTNGWNNADTQQISDYEVIFTVSRVQCVEELDRSTWATVVPVVTQYGGYSMYVTAGGGGLQAFLMTHDDTPSAAHLTEILFIDR